MKYVSNFNDVLYQKTEEVLDYGVVLDCGSSGTRVFVYQWHRAPPSQTNELLDIRPLLDQYGHPVQLKVEPGLSSFGKWNFYLYHGSKLLWRGRQRQAPNELKF